MAQELEDCVNFHETLAHFLSWKSEVADFEVVHMKREIKAFAAERRCLGQACLWEIQLWTDPDWGIYFHLFEIVSERPPCAWSLSVYRLVVRPSCIIQFYHREIIFGSGLDRGTRLAFQVIRLPEVNICATDFPICLLLPVCRCNLPDSPRS